jgi:hypothetical protein
MKELKCTVGNRTFLFANTVQNSPLVDILQDMVGFCFRNGGRLHDSSSCFFTESYVKAGRPELLASPRIPLNLGRRIVVVPLYSKRPIVNNNNNKVRKHPVVGFFRLVDGFVVIVIAMTEA